MTALVWLRENYAKVLGLAGMWILFRPYLGVIHDSRIYIGRALANLDPAGLGRELAYVHDGQSEFSIFPSILTLLLRHWGAPQAAMTITVVGLVAFLCAAAFMISRIVSPRMFWPSLACVCLAPSGYGGLNVFHWAEPFATPRIFAEALSLVAIGTLFERKPNASVLLSALASLLHPIMALPAGALTVLEKCRSDWRITVLVIGCLAAALFAAGFGFSLFDRLFAFPDQRWLSIVRAADPYLFPQLWKSSDWALLGCQCGTVLLLWQHENTAIRSLALVSAGLALIGIALPVIVPTLLVLQVQTWRAQWVLSFVSAALIPVVAHELWKQGRQGRAALAMFAAAWLSYDQLAVVAIAMSLAIALSYSKVQQPLSRWVETVCWGVAIIVGLNSTGTRAYINWMAFHLCPPEMYSAHAKLIYMHLQLPIVFGFLCSQALLGEALQRRPAITTVAGVSLALLALLSWDARSASDQVFESGQGEARLLPPIGPGQVLWLNINRTTALWSANPEWWSLLQGSGLIFDRALALEWGRRLDHLRNAGLVGPNATEDLQRNSAATFARPVRAESLRLACNRGPDWIAVPVRQVTSNAAKLEHARWEAPEKLFAFDFPARHFIGTKFIAIFDCAEIATAGAH